MDNESAQKLIGIAEIKEKADLLKHRRTHFLITGSLVLSAPDAILNDIPRR